MVKRNGIWTGLIVTNVIGAIYERNPRAVSEGNKGRGSITWGGFFAFNGQTFLAFIRIGR